MSTLNLHTYYTALSKKVKCTILLRRFSPPKGKAFSLRKQNYSRKHEYKANSLKNIGSTSPMLEVTLSKSPLLSTHTHMYNSKETG